MRRTATLLSFRSFLLGVLLALSGLLASPYRAAAQTSEGAVPDSTELRVLRQFYTSTGGPNWVNHNGWPATDSAWATATIAQAANWFGVLVEGGDVVRFYYRGNNLRGSLPASLPRLSQLYWLVFEDCAFTGPVPALLGQMPNLQILYLPSCGFTGSVPTWFTQLPKLWYICLSSNRLTGSIPKELGQLTNLQELYLDNGSNITLEQGNRLTGGIPKELGQMTNLRKLALDMNPLGGPIPKELGQLKNLWFLELDDNGLTGEVPLEVLNLPSLSQLLLGASNNVNYHNPNKLTLPPPSQLVNPGRLQLLLQMCQFDFGDLEPYFTAPGQLLTGAGSFYAPQNRPPVTVDTLVVAGQGARFTARLRGLRTRYQWQRLVAGQWVDMPGDTLATKTWASLRPADAGSYRAQATNRLVTGLTLSSPTYALDVTPYPALARNLPVDGNGVPKLQSPPDAADAKAARLVPDLNYVRVWTPRVALTDAASGPTRPPGIRREEWANVPSTGTPAIPVTTTPALVTQLPSLEATSTGRFNYGARLRAWLVPPVTGTYTLYLSATHAGKLYLSTSTSPADTVRLATGAPYTTSIHNYTSVPQQAGTVSLIAGQAYYLEVQHQHQWGAGYVSVGWQLPGGAVPTGPISGQYLRPVVPGESAPGAVTWSVEQAAMSTQYLDGLGRPLQTVQWQASPTKHDVVQVQQYDALDREPRQYLPYVADSTSGGFRPRGLAEQGRYYGQLPATGPPSPTDLTQGVARTGVAFSETLFEASPLNRVLAQAAPGEASQLTSGHHQERLERPNVGVDSVLRFSPSYDPRDLDPHCQGNYAPGELWGTFTRDEHGFWSGEWKDKLGQVVSKQVQTLPPGRGASAPRRWLRTLYVYDDFEHLRFVLPPEASRRLLATVTALAPPPPPTGIRLQRWDNANGSTIADIPLTQPPTSTRVLGQLEEGSPNGDFHYGARLQAWLSPPQGGDYTFYLTGDEAAELWLSPDADPTHKVRLLSVSSQVEYTDSARQYTRYATQRSVPVTLRPDQVYYLEVLHKQDWNKAYASVSWRQPDGSPVGQPIAGRYLLPYDESRPAPAALGSQPLPAANLPTAAAAAPTTAPLVTGSIQREEWANVDGSQISDIPVSRPPTSTSRLYALEGPTNQSDYYGARIRGYLVAPQTGAYTFWLSGDDQCELWLSTDADPAHKQRLATVPDYTSPREWTKYPQQQSVAVSLVAGQAYYVEVLHKEYVGPDNVAVTWRWPDGTHYGTPIAGQYLAPYQPQVASPVPTDLRTYMFHYRYDGRGRQIAKQVPGQDGETLVVYDQLDRPVLSQDAQQRTRREWSWSKYDALGRVVLTGLVTRPDTLGQVSLQAMAAADTATVHQYEQRTADQATYPQYYTTRQAFPRLGAAGQQGFGEGLVLTASYFDDYDFDNDGQPDASYDVSQDGQFASGQAPVADALRTTGLATGTRTRVLGVAENDPQQAAWLTTASFYDERGRVVQVQSTNSRKGKDLVTSQLDFTGKVVQSVTAHQTPSLGAQALVVKESFAYDHMGRVLASFQQLPGEAQPTLLDSLHYNELGQVTRKTLGTGRLRQDVDYAYNIRGWLTSLNNPYAPDPKDLFNLSLHYEAGFTPGYEQYNGNLTGQTWRGHDGVQRAQGYVYDPLNRLLQGDFVARTGGASASQGAWTQELDNYRLSFVSYDDNGNILTLRRRGLLQAATSRVAKQYGEVDNLSYAYQGNRLQAVNDLVSGNQLPQPASYHGAPTSLAGDFQEGGVQQAQEYGYDANGNLTSDLNKGITGILYNHLNLPRQIHFGQGADSVVFRYTAAGQKVAKLVYQTGKAQPLRTDYLGPYQYERDSLQFFPHADGRVLRFVSYDAANQPTVRYQREYTLKDHLGNLRLAYRAGQVRRLLATLEQDEPTHKREIQEFDRLSVSPPIAFATSTSLSGGNWAARLNAGTANGDPQPLGPLTQLGVQKGDTVIVEANGYYASPVQHGFFFSLASFVANLFHPASPPPAGLEAQKRLGFPLLQVGVAAGLSSIPQLGSGVPKGYLRVIVFTRDSVLAPNQPAPVQLSQAANGQYEPLRLQLVLPQDGYVTAYVGNESDVDVLFDEISVEHRPGLQVQETQYDPAGLELAGLAPPSPGIKGLNNYRFNGKEFQMDLGLSWNHQDWRFLDPTILRWNAVDPEIENAQESWTPYSFGFDNAVRYADADGRWPGPGGLTQEQVSMGVHTALDLVGLIPGAGEVADGANALLYLAEGNKVDAALSVAAMLPLAGMAATGAKFLRKADKVVTAGKDIEKGAEFLMDTNAIIYEGKRLKEAGKNLVKDAVVEGEMKNIVARGKIKGTPKVMSEIPSVPSSKNVHARINVRAKLTPKLKGNYRDGIIGATALERKSILVTGDKALTKAVNELGGKAVHPSSL